MFVKTVVFGEVSRLQTDTGQVKVLNNKES